MMNNTYLFFITLLLSSTYLFSQMTQLEKEELGTLMGQISVAHDQLTQESNSDVEQARVQLQNIQRRINDTETKINALLVKETDNERKSKARARIKAVKDICNKKLKHINQAIQKKREEIEKKQLPKIITNSISQQSQTLTEVEQLLTFFDNNPSHIAQEKLTFAGQLLSKAEQKHTLMATDIRDLDSTHLNQFKSNIKTTLERYASARQKYNKHKQQYEKNQRKKNKHTCAICEKYDETQLTLAQQRVPSNEHKHRSAILMRQIIDDIEDYTDKQVLETADYFFNQHANDKAVVTKTQKELYKKTHSDKVKGKEKLYKNLNAKFELIKNRSDILRDIIKKQYPDYTTKDVIENIYDTIRNNRTKIRITNMREFAENLVVAYLTHEVASTIAYTLFSNHETIDEYLLAQNEKIEELLQ